MQFGDFFFDGDKRKVYEAPSGFSYTLDGNGYRIYTPDDEPSASTTTTYDFQRDLWSNYVNYMFATSWATRAMLASGGDQRPDGSYATADFLIYNAWQIVPADYDHAIIIQGNVSSSTGHPLLDVFDFERLTKRIVPLLQGADALITYRIEGGSILTQDEHDKLIALSTAEENINAFLDEDASCSG